MVKSHAKWPALIANIANVNDAIVSELIFHQIFVELCGHSFVVGLEASIVVAIERDNGYFKYIIYIRFCEIHSFESKY